MERAHGPTRGSCQRCPELAALVEEGESKANELARRNHDQQQELERLRQVEAEVDAVRVRSTERRQRLEALEQNSEEQAHVRQQLEREVRRVCNQNADMLSQASATTGRLQQTQRDLHAAREALDDERSVRERGEATVGVLERELVEERAGCDKFRKEAAKEREMRRRSEIEASATESAQKKALKAALSSSVRLCIVAPTVNINLDERSRSFCSGLPEEKIREFVERSVLPQFTRVLLQPSVDTTRVTPGNSAIVTETASTDVATPSSSMRAAAGKTIVDDPCGRQSPEKSRGKGDEKGCRPGDGRNQEKADFDKWLRDLLVDMQTSIEKHVASVYQTQTKQAARGSVSIR